MRPLAGAERNIGGRDHAGLHHERGESDAAQKGRFAVAIDTRHHDEGRLSADMLLPITAVPFLRRQRSRQQILH